MAEEESCDSISSLLLELGANIDTTDNNGYTPLSIAAESGNTNLVKFLVSQGAYIEHQTNRGITPLLLAAAKFKLDTVICLLELGATIRVRCLYGLASDRNLNALKLLQSVIPERTSVVDYYGCSALHWAACDNNIANMEILLKNNLVDVDGRDHNGSTPLHTAIKHGHIESVEYLISKGANVFANDNQGRSPFHLAILWKQKKIARIIEHKMNVDFYLELQGFKNSVK